MTQFCGSVGFPVANDAIAVILLSIRKNIKMKQVFLPFLTAICLLAACSNDNKESSKTETTSSLRETNATSLPSAKPEDDAAIAIIETDAYILKVHKAIPFMPDATKTAGAFKPKDGNQYIALDISVKSKSNQPLEMGSLMLATQVTDEKGSKFGELIPALTSYTLTYPDSKQQEEYDAIWSEEYAPGQQHRTVAFGFEAPKEVKTFIIKMPVKAYASETKQATFTL